MPFHIVTYTVSPKSDDFEEKKDNSNVEEIITFAGFISDYDPSLIFIMTYCEAKNLTYLKVLKIEKKDIERSYSVYEDDEKKVLIENLRNNLLA